MNRNKIYNKSIRWKIASKDIANAKKLTKQKDGR